MPTIDQKFTQRLDDFTRALDGIVEILKEDIKKKNVDNVNEMLANMNNDIAGIVHNLETVVESVGRIEANTNQILEELRASRKEKETGVFRTISETENKKRIIDAVKIITLIAAGVLALGLAFKIISPVDFLSVIAIGLSIVFIAGAFVMVSALTEGMTWKDAIGVSAIMVTMSMGLAVSSWALATSATLTFAKVATITFTATAMAISLPLIFLAVKKAKLEPKDYAKALLLPLVLPLLAAGIAFSSTILASVVPLTFGQIITTVFVATAIGASMFLIAQALDKAKMKKKHVAQFLLLPIIIPALAIGLVIASVILSGIHPLTLMQMVSSIFVAVTIGVLVYLMKPLIEKMKDFSLGQIVNTTIMVAAIAAGLVLASHILTKMSFFTIKQSLQLIMTSLSIGLAVLFLTPAILILKSIETEDMLKAASNVIIASAAIFTSSWLLSYGNYENYPDWRWSLGTSLAIVAFAGTIWLINKMKFSYKELLTGGLVVIGISTVITAVSWILALGNYEDYPDVSWAIGVGLSLIVFGGFMMIIGFIIASDKTGTAATSLAVGALTTIGVALVIAGVSWILALGNYDEYPGLDWAAGVGLSLISFGMTMTVLGFALPLLALGALSVGLVVATIAAASILISQGEYDKGPTSDWAESVNSLIQEFSWTMLKTALIPNRVLEGCAVGLLTIAQNIVDVSKKLKEGDYTGGPTSNWALSVGALMMTFTVASLMVTASLPLLFIGMFGMNKIAQTIVDVSKKLKEGDYTGGPSEEWAKGVGLSIKAFAEGISALQESDSFWSFGGEDQSKKITNIADAMIQANKLLASVVWSNNHPTSEWAKGVGDSIMAFANALALLEDADISGVGFMIRVALLSKSLIVAAQILDSYNWAVAKNYPSVEWSTGVSNAIKSFVEPLTKMEESDVSIRDIRKISRALVQAAEIIGEYDNWGGSYPSEEWSSAVGKALEVFVKHLVEIEKSDIGRSDIRNLNRLIDSMIETAIRLSESGDIWNNYPPTEWSDGVIKAIEVFTSSVKMLSGVDDDFDLLRKFGNSIVSFAFRVQILNTFKGLFVPGGVMDLFSTSMKKLVDSLPTTDAVGGLKTLVEMLNSISTMGITSSFSIYMLSRSIGRLGKALRELDTESLNSLSKFSNGILVMSLIDDKKLQDTLKLLDSKKDDIKMILSDNPIEKRKPVVAPTTIIETRTVEEAGEKNKFYEDLLSYVKNLDANVTKIAERGPVEVEEYDNEPTPSPNKL